MLQTLILSPDYVPIQKVTWMRALSLWYSGKARIESEYEEFSVRSPSMEMKVPAVIVLHKHKRPKHKAVRYSRDQVYNRDKGCCQYCGEFLKRAEITLDHVIPREQYGKTTWDNIVVCCGPCNQKKMNRTPQQAGMKLLNLPKQPKTLGDGMEFAHQNEANTPKYWIPYLVAYSERK